MKPLAIAAAGLVVAALCLACEGDGTSAPVVAVLIECDKDDYRDNHLETRRSLSYLVSRYNGESWVRVAGRDYLACRAFIGSAAGESAPDHSYSASALIECTSGPTTVLQPDLTEVGDVLVMDIEYHPFTHPVEYSFVTLETQDAFDPTKVLKKTLFFECEARGELADRLR